MDEKPPRRRKPRLVAPAPAQQGYARPARDAAGSLGFPAGPGLGIGAMGLQPATLTGQLLIAMPSIDTPYFNRSVIYVCAHTAEGAMGIVLNSPLDSPSFDDLLAQLGVAPTPPNRRVALCKGGPVESARGFVLHTADWTGDGSLVVDEAVALTASLDVLKAIADGGGPREGLLALGYAGWSAGQLEAEMQQNGWLNVPAEPSLIFDPSLDSKYERAVRMMGIDLDRLSTQAGHA